ncbi:uncharacterized protein TNCV_3029611 [Trichonephila clavipes]|nr:uncharacterized protein TNCV_3029611 [Trichonephila clavipes]
MEHLSELDQRMKNILHNKDLTEEEKTILYLQILQKYTHFSNENRRESEPVPNEASLSENQETESLKENLKELVVKTEKEVFENKIFRIVPARYKEKAKNIFQFLKLQESFSWNSDGEIIYKNTVIPGSNIAFLVNDFLRNRKSAPEGRYVFLRALNDVNLPKNLDVLDESRSFFRVHTGYFSNIPKCIKAEFIASCGDVLSPVLYRAPSVRINLIVCLIELCSSFDFRDKFGGGAGYNYVKRG